jgi:hypothetical protein
VQPSRKRASHWLGIEWLQILSTGQTVESKRRGLLVQAFDMLPSLRTQFPLLNEDPGIGKGLAWQDPMRGDRARPRFRQDYADSGKTRAFSSSNPARPYI